MENGSRCNAVSDASRPLSVGVLLIDGFALMAYASIIEPFRAANVLSGQTLYRWTHFSVDGGPVRASNGATMLPDGGVGDDAALDMLFVVAGGDPTTFHDRATFAWLRKLSRSNVRLGGVSGGPFILARAAVLEGYRCTIHWDHAPAFEETFPTHLLERGLYVIDRNRLTCAGGSAGLDLGVELIEREHGQELGLRVSEWFIRTEARRADGPQRMSLRERYGVRNPAVLIALARMEAAVEEPEERETLAKRAGVSVRQLERLFAKHVGETIAEAYMKIRLEHADMLLQRTGLSVTEVSLACGFATSSHFSRTYKARYGKPPSEA